MWIYLQRNSRKSLDMNLGFPVKTSDGNDRRSFSLLTNFFVFPLNWWMSPHFYEVGGDLVQSGEGRRSFVGPEEGDEFRGEAKRKP
jgi:hypothetical protein